MTERDSRPTSANPRPEELTAPEAVIDHYRSIDSAPAEYSLDRSARAVNSFLLWFVGVSLLALLALTIVVRLGHVEDSRDLVLFASEGDRPAVPIRLFALIFFAVFSLCLATDLWRRFLVLVELCGGVLLISLLADLGALAIHAAFDVSVPVLLHQVSAAMLALALFPVVMLRNAHLPDPVRPPERSRRGRVRPSAWLRLVIPLALAGCVAALLELRFEDQVKAIRDIALIGGLGPGVFLVQQLVALFAAAIGLVIIDRSRRSSISAPIAVVVPAYNEAHGIAATIEAIDRAAAAYAGTTHLYLVDNASTDSTAEEARRAIERSEHLEGELLTCPDHGKARALNYGFERVREPFVVRVDADVVVSVNAFDIAMRHFTSPSVGAVGGIPLPCRVGSFIERVRLVEVLVRHGFFQVARMGYDGIPGEPGMFTAYRRSALDEAGPLVLGMNGEDTDIGMRLNALGYRSMVDPRVVYRTETPRTFAHLREQRTRWFRSAYHVAAHNSRTLLRPYSMASVLILPFALLNSARRAMLFPVLLFAVLVLGIFADTFTGLRWQPAVATVLGLPMLVAILVCLLLGRPRAVLYVPEFLVFRFMRSYYTLGALLSLRFPPLGPPWRSARGRPRRRQEPSES